MSVKATRARIHAAITQLHEATIEYDRTPNHYKYEEVTALDRSEGHTPASVKA